MGFMTVYGKVRNGTAHVTIEILHVFIHLTYRKKDKGIKRNKKGIAELLPSLYTRGAEKYGVI